MFVSLLRRDHVTHSVSLSNLSGDSLRCTVTSGSPVLSIQLSD